MTPEEFLQRLKTDIDKLRNDAIDAKASGNEGLAWFIQGQIKCYEKFAGLLVEDINKQKV